MTDQARQPGSTVDAGVAAVTSTASASDVENETVGYARADLRDALARIRGASDARTLPEPDRAHPLDRPADERSTPDEVRALAAAVDRVAGLVRSMEASTASLAALAARDEERLDRIERRLVALSVVVAILVVAVGALAVLLMLA